MSNIGGVIKSIRDIFRKDPGLSGDAQRIEQLGWMIFSNFLMIKTRKENCLIRNTSRPFPHFTSGAPGQKMMKVKPEND